jgi:hypothetical protein
MGADTFTADAGQHIDAAGNVTYDFDAHVHARGLDLDAGGGINPPADRRIRWIDVADGSVVAEIYAVGPAGAFFGRVLRSQVNAPGGPTGIVAYAGADGGVYFNSNGVLEQPIWRTADGASRFVQVLGDPARLTFARGIGVVTIGAGTYGSANAGSVTVDLPNMLTLVPHVQLTRIAGGSLLFSTDLVVSSYEPGRFEVVGSVLAPGTWTGATLMFAWTATNAP